MTWELYNIAIVTAGRGRCKGICSPRLESDNEVDIPIPRKLEKSTQCWLNIGPPSATLAQH